MRLILGLTILLAAASASLAKEPDSFAKQKAAFTAKLKNRAQNIRLEAARQLAEHRRPEAAQLLWQIGLHDGDLAVRWAAYDSLVSYRDDADLGLAMLQEFEIELTKVQQQNSAAMLLGALLSCDDASVRAKLERALIDAPPRATLPPAILLCESLAVRAIQQDVLPLQRLAKTDLAGRSFPVRRAAIQGLLAIPHRDAIAALVDILPRLKGEVRADALIHLQAVTGRRPADDAAWSQWWQEGGPKFEYPRQGSYQPGQRSPEALGAQSYYGQPLFAERLVFIFDNSSSMAGPRIVSARRELLKAIAGLPESVSFSIVVFNSTSVVWQKELVPATPANVASASAFVRRIDTDGKTNSFEALSNALRFDAEALYFLSDGEPTTGSIVEPGPIIAAVCEQNRLKRMSIYTIGIQPGPVGNALDTFLNQLAAKNIGQYRRVEE